MLNPRGESLSRILARRMAATSLAMLMLIAMVFSIHEMVDDIHLREAALNASAIVVAESLDHGGNPAHLRLYRTYPNAYGFRVYDHSTPAKRHLLASANTERLPAVVSQMPGADDSDDVRNPAAGNAKLVEGFTLLRVLRTDVRSRSTVGLLTKRVGFADRHYWVQVYMVDDPAFTFINVIIDDLVKQILIPALFIIPALTLAIFLTTRKVLHPLRQLSDSADRIGTAVSRGKARVPVPEGGMAKEFASVAATINAILTKLDHSLQLQKQFTSDVAHELRTPLAVLLLDISQIPPGTARDQFKSHLKQLTQLVDELLRFAQAEDVMFSEIDDVDIVAVTRQVVEEAVPEALTKRQVLELDSAIETMIVPGSMSLLKIAIRNLVGNALKYSPSKSAITIVVEPGPLVVVEDCGPGIPAEHRDQVFQRFWRLDRQSGNGAGVGLALVRRIAQLHDGSICMEERPGGGTRIIFSLVGSASS